MKKQVMLIAALMMSTIIFAQHRDGNKRREGMSEKMKTELMLNDTQYANLKSINEKFDARHEALRKDSLKTKEEKSQAMKSMRTEKEKEISAILTAEQNTKWKAVQAERAEKGKAHMVKAREEHDAKMKAELALTDDQFTKVKAENNAFRKKMHAVHASDGKENVDRKAEFSKLKGEHEATMKAILSAEQFQKWTAMKGKHDKHKRKG